MKLEISKDQDKGFLGGISFSSVFRLVLTSDEKIEIDTFNLGGLVIVAFEDKRTITLNSLITGWTGKAKDIAQMLQFEQMMIDTVKGFKTYFDSSKKFIRKEVVALSSGDSNPEAMNLEVAKSITLHDVQGSDCSSGISFVLNCRLVVSEAVRKSIGLYRFQELPVVTFEDQTSITVGSLLAGWTGKANDISVVTQFEETIVNAAKSFNSYFTEAEGFIGEEKIAIGDNASAHGSISLTVKKAQTEKYFGGVRFLMNSQAVLSQSGMDLIKSFKLESTRLNILSDPLLTVGRLLGGVKYENSIFELEKIKAELVEACERLEWYLSAMSNFGGETRVDMEEGVVLVATRDQKKGMLGGISFTLSLKLDVSSTIDELIKIYRLKDFVLFKSDTKTIYVKNILEGIKENCKDVGVLMENEEVYKGTVDTLVSYIHAMKNFGGILVIDL